MSPAGLGWGVRRVGQSLATWGAERGPEPRGCSLMGDMHGTPCDTRAGSGSPSGALRDVTCFRLGPDARRTEVGHLPRLTVSGAITQGQALLRCPHPDAHAHRNRGRLPVMKAAGGHSVFRASQSRSVNLEDHTPAAETPSPGPGREALPGDSPGSVRLPPPRTGRPVQGRWGRSCQNLPTQ